MKESEQTLIDHALANAHRELAKVSFSMQREKDELAIAAYNALGAALINRPVNKE